MARKKHIREVADGRTAGCQMFLALVRTLRTGRTQHMTITSQTTTGLLVVAAQLLAGSAAYADQRPLQRRTDPATGAELRLYQGQRPGRDARIEIQDPSVLIRKEVANGSLLTTIVAGSEQVSVAIGRDGLVVTRGSQRVSADRAHRDQLEVARKLVASSAAVARAKTLLAKLTSGSASPLRQTAMVTRVMLLTLSGDVAGAEALSRLAREESDRVTIKRASLGEGEEDGPGECWRVYALEAIAAYKEYEDCYNSQSWYDVLGKLGCATVYDMRAIGAFAWWMSCVGLRKA